MGLDSAWARDAQLGDARQGGAFALPQRHHVSNKALRDHWSAFHKQGLRASVNLEMIVETLCAEGDVESQHFWSF